MNLNYKTRYWLNRFFIKFHTPMFVSMLLAVWLLHILFIGWIRYLFYPKMYVIRVGDIIADMDNARHGTPWWNRYDCEAARHVVAVNNPDDIATFTWRTHPFFLDNEFMYVSSSKWKARVWDSRTKVYYR